MSLFTAFGITSIQKESKKNEKKRKATMVIKLVTSVRVLLETFCSLHYYQFIIFHVWHLGLFPAIPRFTVALIITTITSITSIESVPDSPFDKINSVKL